MSLWISTPPRPQSDLGSLQGDAGSECRPTLVPAAASAAEDEPVPSVHAPAPLEPSPDLVDSIHGYELAPPSSAHVMREHLKRCLSDRARQRDQGFRSEPPTWKCRIDWD